MRFCRSVRSQRSSGSSHTGHVVARPDARDGDARVEAAEPFARLGEEPVDLRLDGEVRSEDELAAGRLGSLAAAVVVNRHARALCGERAHARSADPAGAARHEHALPGEPRLHGVYATAPCASTSSATWKASPASSSGSRSSGGEALYEEGRKLYTEEINAAVRGAKAAGATEIVVMDCHGAGKGWTFNSLVPDQLDPDCEWVVQDEWTEYTEFLEQGCDAALFVGMHARAGTELGVLSHTVSGTNWQNLWFNDTLVGETGINAALCGQWGCPVLMVTGDQAVCAEAVELLGDGLTTVEVKRGLGRFSARNVPPVKARALIEEGAKNALSNLSAVAPWDPGRPAEIKVQYAQPRDVQKLRYRHGVEIVEPRTIVSRADDWWTAWRQFYF